MYKNKLRKSGFDTNVNTSKINVIYTIALPLMILLMGLTSNIQTAEAQEPFITIWQTNNEGESEDNQIMIPIEGDGYDFTIEWGDGNTTTWQDGDAIEGLTHTYNSPGIYTVYIFGDFPRIYFNNEGDKEKILSVEHWGEIEWQTMERAFMGASNLQVTATDAPDLSGVTSLDSMFRGASSLNSDLNHWDTRNITNMTALFWGANSFNGDIGNWDTGNVTRMRSMFVSATEFNRYIGGWDVSSVTDMSQMFASTPSFNQNLSGWNTSSVSNMAGIFLGATAFDRPLDSWDFSNVTNLANMMNSSGISSHNYDWLLMSWAEQELQSGLEVGARGLEYCGALSARRYLAEELGWQIAEDSIADACQDAFITLWEVESEDLRITIPTEGTGYDYNVRWGDGTDAQNQTGDASYTYSEAGIYPVVISGDFPRIYFNNEGDKEKIVDVVQWGDIEWTSMEGAFWGASKLDISAVDAPDLSKVTSLARMFRDAESFNADIGHWDTQHVKSMRDLFSGATKFNQDIGDWDVSNVETMRRMFRHAAMFNRNLNEWDTGNVTDMSRMFGDAESFNGEIGGWNTSNVEDMRRMFEGAVAFNQDIGNWNTDKVTRMEIMFDGATSFNQDISGWNTSGVTSMRRMFRDAASFNQDIGSWNMRNVTNVEVMFHRAASFNGDISDWNTENITSTDRMFMDAVSFNQDISGWNMQSVELLEDMFKNATSFNQNIGNWNVSNVTWFGDLFDNTNLSIANYDSTLIGWASQAVHNDMIIGSEGLNFCEGADARQKLIDEYNWEFTGDSEMCELVLDSPELIAPAEDTTITNHEIELSWKPVNNAETYTVLIAGDSEFADIIFEESGLESTDLLITDLEPNSTHYWRVRAEAGDTESLWSNYRSFSTGEFTNLDNDSNNLPAEFELAQNFPNPFNPTTQIRYSLPESAQVRLEVFNTLGQRVAVLVNEARPAGRHEASFDAAGLSSGLYIYRLQTESYTETRQMMLVK